MSPRALVIVNPQSGGGATGRAWTGLRRSLETTFDGRYWDEVFTKGPLHATAVTRMAIEEGYDQLVVVGGDGTLNEVVNGLFPEDKEMGIGLEPTRPDLRLTVVRRGTGGDFARALALPGTGGRVFNHVLSDRLAPLDLGICTFKARDGSTQRRAFANIASFGLSGLVDQKVNSSRKGGRLTYVQAILSAVVEYRRQPVQIRVDGDDFYEGHLLLGVVANAPYFGGGLKIAPNADTTDGLFDIVLLSRVGGREVVKALDLYSGRHVRWDKVLTTRAQKMEVSVKDDSACLLDLDGEQPGQLKASFEIVPNAAQLVQP